MSSSDAQSPIHLPHLYQIIDDFVTVSNVTTVSFNSLLQHLADVTGLLPVQLKDKTVKKALKAYAQTRIQEVQASQISHDTITVADTPTLLTLPSPVTVSLLTNRPVITLPQTPLSPTIVRRAASVSPSRVPSLSANSTVSISINSPSTTKLDTKDFFSEDDSMIAALRKHKSPTLARVLAQSLGSGVSKSVANRILYRLLKQNQVKLITNADGTKPRWYLPAVQEKDHHEGVSSSVL